ncbi:MAG: UDP-N-acetylmuramoyl-tripeptide--D-alanyl-D-alanine ligase [Candidatus Omnitrophica bacterium]|nr:UDP-N-acetylmuramoyl-tripeptide--D-alanyl-D-alanine ligase [Candidatus Omnitrophota bacterium]
MSIDSRALVPGDAFLAIPGPRFDGHDFLDEAVTRGAACLIVSRLPDPRPPVPVIRVPDTIRALGDVAAFHRRRFAIPVIAVTGSCGKTTTKELLAHLLSQDHRVLKTTGTQNNHIGLPLTLLKLSAAHQAAVVELGSNHPGEIAYLARLAGPTVAVITNVGPAHLEFFGSLDVVRREKLSLLEALDPTGAAVIPGDQLEVLLHAKGRLAPGTTLLTFGTSDQCGVQGLDIRREARGVSLAVRGVSGRFVIPLPGPHNVENALAALAGLQVLGIPLESVQERFASFAPIPLRSQLVQCDGLTIINDCYNANPLSFARALETLKGLEVQRRVVIAGDMLELGAIAPAAHQAIGRLAAELGIEMIVAVGRSSAEIVRGAAERGHTNTAAFPTVPELLERLPALIQSGDGVLVKGSRKMQLEHVTDALMRRCHEPGIPVV